MTIYKMKRAKMCLGRDYVIEDEGGHRLFYLDAKAFAKAHRISFETTGKHRLAFIEEKPGPVYEITRDERRAAKIWRTTIEGARCRFTVDVPGPDDLLAEGNFAGYDYVIARHGMEVARVSKDLCRWEEGYGIEVQPDEDDILLLAAAVVVDLVVYLL